MLLLLIFQIPLRLAAVQHSGNIISHTLHIRLAVGGEGRNLSSSPESLERLQIVAFYA